MTKREIINKNLLNLYRKDKIEQYILEKEPSCKSVERRSKEILSNLSSEEFKDIMGFVIVSKTNQYSYKFIKNIEKESKNKNLKNFHIIGIDKINDELPSFAQDISLLDNGFLDIGDITGTFKVSFSDGTFLYYSRWFSGFGKSMDTEGLVAAEKPVWINFLKLMKKEKRKIEKPKNGVFRFVYNNFSGQPIYEPIKGLQKNEVIHPSSETLFKDMDFYFKNVELFTRFGMPGVRKSLIVGPPGTGKTSIAIKVAEKFKKEKSIAFCTNIQEAAFHLSFCSKYNKSSIAILEDAESSLQQADSNLLNFLDGINLPKNINGSYVIMTTNFPERIEPRIIKRPGRIDKIIPFENLKGEFALRCSEIYFQDIFLDKNTKFIGKEKSEMLKIVDNMTGAEIKELAQATASFAASENKVVDIGLISEVKEKMKDILKDISKYAYANSSVLNSEKKIGFTNL